MEGKRDKHTPLGTSTSPKVAHCLSRTVLLVAVLGSSWALRCKLASHHWIQSQVVPLPPSLVSADAIPSLGGEASWRR